MRGAYAMLAVALCVMSPPAGADIFARVRPADTALREAMQHDRGQYYLLTSGGAYEQRERPISPLKGLRADGFSRKPGLRDVDTVLEKYLRKELSSGKIPRNEVALTHPLMLLEYSSPVMADVIKHYRMAAYERLSIEEARLAQVDVATEGRVDRLAWQSVRECLERHADNGLVEAMRICQRAPAVFDALVNVNGQGTLQDGRRRIHVVAQALTRLGLERGRIEKVIAMAGDQVIADDGYESVLPLRTFDGMVQQERQKLTRAWREAIEKYKRTGRVSVGDLEGFSLPGAPVTYQTLADLLMLEDDRMMLRILKMAFVQAEDLVLQEYREAVGYLDRSITDPRLPEEFRRMVSDKKDFMKAVVLSRSEGKGAAAAYKELLSELAQDADHARARLQRVSAEMEAQRGSPGGKVLLLNY